jgi:hypothetical protein
MEAKSFEDFQAAFPKLYANVRCGFYCPPGWVDIVWRLSEKLEPIGVQCDQVKEKFGSLRFYTHGLASFEAESAALPLIRAAEDEAARTCDLCGKPGQLGKLTPTYVRLLCPEHTPDDVAQDVPRILTDPEGFASEFREAISKKAEP